MRDLRSRAEMLLLTRHASLAQSLQRGKFQPPLMQPGIVLWQKECLKGRRRRSFHTLDHVDPFFRNFGHGFGFLGALRFGRVAESHKVATSTGVRDVKVFGVEPEKVKIGFNGKGTQSHPQFQLTWLAQPNS